MRTEASKWKDEDIVFDEKNSDEIRVGVGEVVVSGDPDAILVVHAVECCIALIAHDRKRRVGGILHFLLPSSVLSQTDARDRPGLFADTGIPILFDKLGASSLRELTFKAVGGASQHERDPFDVGRRNCVALHSELRRLEISLSGAALGGNISRRVALHVGSGRTVIRSNPTGDAFEI